MLLGIVLLALAGLVQARPSPVAARQAMEASMLVTGEIMVDARGAVDRYEIDRREQIPPAVQEFIDRIIPGWQFEPVVVEGGAVAIHNRMSLLLVAKATGPESVKIDLRAASFFPVRQEGYELEPVAMDPPVYPKLASELGISGTVYLVLRIAADGSVQDVAVEQVNLRNYGSTSDMDRWRMLLGRNAANKARQWRFSPPRQGEHASAADWTVRVPLAYALGDRRDSYGRWEAYVPGPVQRASWLAEDGVAPDALAQGGLYPVGGPGALRLLPAAGG